MTARDVFEQNNGDVTKSWYAEMNARGPAGQLAVALFRAQKRSAAAKSYRRGRWKHAAYDVKNWSISEVCRLLSEHAEALGIRWGWKSDPDTPGYEWVLYCDLPQGQVSFHSPSRGCGPDYAGEFDGARGMSELRILAFCDSVAMNQVAAGATA